MIKLTPIVKNLLRINILAFILTYILFAAKIPFIENFLLFNFTSDSFQIYQLLTYMFLHSSFIHILFNMIGLITFGPDIEESIGSKKFLNLYLISGLFSGLCHALFMSSPVLGASGAIWGIMVFYALLKPNTILHLYFLIPVKVKYIVSVFFIIELYLTIVGSSDGVSHIAHTAGGVMGFLIFLYNRKLKY